MPENTASPPSRTGITNTGSIIDQKMSACKPTAAMPQANRFCWNCPTILSNQSKADKVLRASARDLQVPLFTSMVN